MPVKILLVDDNVDFRSEFSDCFDCYEVVEAGDGEEALKILNRPNEIDLVMLDVNLPGAKGTDILKKIKAIAPDLRIIILTAYSSEDTAIEALKGRADDYLQKPLDVEKTREVIERLLESKNGGMSDSTDKIGKVKHYLERNCYKKVCLKDAAEAVALSPKYLSRMFKEASGMGFNEYRLDVMIKAAKSLLEMKGLNIDQVACKMGYRNTESFTRIFKELVGETPTSYRKKVKKSK
jgi:two-component system, response regulator YesN